MQASAPHAIALLSPFTVIEHPQVPIVVPSSSTSRTVTPAEVHAAAVPAVTKSARQTAAEGRMRHRPTLCDSDDSATRTPVLSVEVQGELDMNVSAKGWFGADLRAADLHSAVEIFTPTEGGSTPK
ncbi:MAG: hypothetical protein U0169_18785 [Polyangiaceae bacterium]